VALQTTTRELWAAEGPFEVYELQGPVHRDIPERFIKAAEWRVHNGIERYHARSTAPEESSSERWYAVEFNFEHLCWVEIRWIENLEIGGHWEAFRIAGEDLGLDITSQDAADQDQLDRARRPRDTKTKPPQREQVRRQQLAKQALYKYDPRHHKEEAIKSSHYS
jgi:hypothetical protein